MNLPNKLTMLRIFLVPVFIACFYIKADFKNYIAAGIFLIAYFTDLLDGAYARKYNLVTEFGKFMDPIADKLLTSSAIIMLTANAMMSPIAAIIIIAREFIISGFRLVAVKSGIVIAASKLGKIKTVTQCIAITLILLKNPLFSLWNIPFDQIMLWFAVLMTIWSAVDYLIKNTKNLNFN